MDGPLKWAEIGGFPGYRVSSAGAVQSCWTLKALGGRNGTRAVMTDSWSGIVVSTLPNGRKYVCLSVSGRRKNRYVAHLVLEAFVGPRPVGMEACHEDGDCGNNAVENLRWDTHQGNVADKIRHGTHNRGARHNMAKLTEAGVHDARRRISAGESLSAVARSLGVSKGAVAGIASGKTWRHLRSE